MNRDLFLGQIERLRLVFGANKWPDEKVSTVWQRVREKNDDHFRMAVDEIIMEHDRSPPLSAIEAIYYKKQNAANRFVKPDEEQVDSVLDDSERVMLIAKCKERAFGRVPDDEWLEFRRVVDKMISDRRGARAPKCKCENGLVFDQRPGGLFVFRCSCPLGEKQPMGYPVWQQ